MSDTGVDGRTSPTPLRVPEPTVERLSTYLQFLYSAAASGLTTISSAHVESATAVSAAQFRKDLSYFGEFGKPGVGYVIAELQTRISRILQLHETQPVILIGLGNLGAALLSYPGLTEQRFQVVAAFDIDPSKCGRTVQGVPVYGLAELTSQCARLNPRIAILAVPGQAAQQAFDLAYKTGVRAILNFAPAVLRVPSGVTVRNVSFTQELAVLSYHIKTDQLES